MEMMIEQSDPIHESSVQWLPHVEESLQWLDEGMWLLVLAQRVDLVAC